MEIIDNIDSLKLLEQLNQAIATTEIVALVQTLAANKIKVAIAPLIKLLHHHNPLVSTVAVSGLVQLAPDSVEELITAFQACKDHGVQAYIVQALAQIGDVRATDLLIEVVGTEVANHCQGNVRRVAARGLGKIGKINNSEIRQKVINKLTWALLKPQDWALRYAAVVSLEEIATEATTSALKSALSQELEQVVNMRIKTALGS
jgi:phycoerythrocyanin alpha-cysteine-84 phycoviolobilin lyase/isomerase subunit PecF